MESPLLTAGIPLMLALVVLERILLRAQARWFVAEDTYANVGSGAFQQALLFLIAPPLAAGYVWLQQQAAPLTLSAGSLATWAVALVGVDLVYYFWHRASHRVNALWAAHVVHHQSESFNLSVALRQSLASDLTAWPFYLLLAVAGVPIEVFAGAKAIHTLYQFWIHAERFPRLGPLEWLLVTPAHHRLHHARNAPYLDKNYGAIFIVWDRLFGTFAAQTEPPVYGITEPLRTFDPVAAQLEPWRQLAAAARETGPAILLRGPEHLPHSGAPFLADTPGKPAVPAPALIALLLLAAAGLAALLLLPLEPLAAFAVAGGVVVTLAVGGRWASPRANYCFSGIQKRSAPLSPARSE